MKTNGKRNPTNIFKKWKTPTRPTFSKFLTLKNRAFYVAQKRRFSANSEAVKCFTGVTHWCLISELQDLVIDIYEKKEFVFDKVYKRHDAQYIFEKAELIKKQRKTRMFAKLMSEVFKFF